MGRSPQDVEDQITYPLTVSLLGVPGVKTVRSYSFFGFSTIYVIFDEDVEFYWSRTRVLEKLNSLPDGTLARRCARRPSVQMRRRWDRSSGTRWKVAIPTASQSAVGISTNCGRSKIGTSATICSRPRASAEVASIGGFVQEYQIDVDPDAMRAARVGIDDIFMAVKDVQH